MGATVDWRFMKHELAMKITHRLGGRFVHCTSKESVLQN